MLMAITQGVHSVHQKVYQLKTQVFKFNSGDNDSQGFYVIQWTYTYYKDKIISTFTTMRVVQFSTVVIILQTSSYSGMKIWGSNQLIMLLWCKLSRYVVMTDIQDT